MRQEQNKAVMVKTYLCNQECYKLRRVSFFYVGVATATKNCVLLSSAALLRMRLERYE
jgi:hypothetical protein